MAQDVQEMAKCFYCNGKFKMSVIKDHVKTFHPSKPVIFKTLKAISEIPKESAISTPQNSESLAPNVQSLSQNVHSQAPNVQSQAQNFQPDVSCGVGWGLFHHFPGINWGRLPVKI